MHLVVYYFPGETLRFCGDAKTLFLGCGLRNNFDEPWKELVGDGSGGGEIVSTNFLFCDIN